MKHRPITARLASVITGIGYITILRHIALGVLPANWQGRHYEIAWFDLLDYAARQWKAGRCCMYPLERLPSRKVFFVDKEWRD